MGKFSREYNPDWSVQKIADFMGDCKRVGHIPSDAKVSSKKKRNGMIQVTWKWKAGR